MKKCLLLLFTRKGSMPIAVKFFIVFFLTGIIHANHVYAQVPCNQRVITDVDFTYNGEGATPPRWNMSQVNAGGFSIDQAAFAYVPAGNFANQNIDWQNANNNPNNTRQYAIVNNPKDLSPQYADIPTDGMIVINPQQGQNEQYGQFSIANLQPGQTYYVEMKFYNVISLSSRGPNNQCYSWCNWNNQLNILWEGNGNNAHDGQSGMTWTGVNGSNNTNGGWDGWGNQVSNWMWVTPNGANAVMRGQMTLGNATTGFTFTFLKKDGSATNPIVLGIDYIKVYGCQAEAINVSGGSTNVCEATAITLTAQGIGPAGAAYSWYQNGVLMPGRTADTLNVVSAIGTGATVTYEARGVWANRSVTLTSKLCCSSVGGTSDEVIRQSFNNLTYTCVGGRSGGYADIPDKNVTNFIDPSYVYAGTNCNSLNDGQYAVVQSSYAGDFWRNRPEVRDHTGVPGSGALFINAIGGVGQAFYRFNLTGLCNATRYEFSAWYASLALGSEIKPNIEFAVMNGNTKVESVSTGIIPENSTWYKAEVTFVTPPTGTPTYTLQLVNLVTGSGGNDLMIDDIVVKKCTPNINLFQDGTKDSIVAVCNDNPVKLKVTTFYDLPLAITGSSNGTVYYQWMKATAPGGPWTLIGTPETTGTYDAIAETTPMYYRVKVSADQARAANGQPPLATECGNDGITTSFRLSKDGNFTVPPVTGTTSYCTGDVLQLIGDTATGDEWEWRKGATFASATVLPGYSFTNDPAKKEFTKTFATADAGIYYFVVKLASGCEGYAQVTVTANPEASATISGSTTVCQGAAAPLLTFTGAGGTAPYTFTYNINGEANQNISTTAGNASVTLQAPTATSGTYIYNLVAVAAASNACNSSVNAQLATVQINPLPAAAISGTVTVPQNAVSPNITFTGTGGTAPYTFTYNINGGNNLTISTTGAGNTATVAVPTGIPGSFAYNLVSVTDAAAFSCSNTVTGTATVTISNLPGAAISGTTTVCLNATAPALTFTGSNGTAPYTFTYTINGGTALTVTTPAGSDNVTVIVPTANAGVYVYAITQVATSGANPGSSPVTNQSATVTVNDQAPPTGIGAARCGTGTVTLTATPVTAGNTIHWYSDAALTTQVATGLTYTTPNISNTSSYYITETSQSGCVSSTSTTVTATVNPGPTQPAGNGQARCGAGTLTLTAAISGAPNNILKWYSDLGLTTQVATGTSFVTPSLTTTTNYYVTETNAAGCASTPVIVTAVIDAIPAAPVAADASRCGPGTMLLTATASGAGSTLQWYSDAALATQVGTGSLFTTATLNAGATYYVTETSAAGCSSVATPVVATIYAVPVAGFTATADCNNKTATFTNTSNGNGATITQWAWNFDDGSAQQIKTDGNTFNWPYPAGGTHTVALTVTTANGCTNAAAFTQVISFGVIPVAAFNASNFCQANGAVTFNNTSTISDASLMTYSWSFGDGNATTLSTPAPPVPVTHNYTAGGNYTVTLTAVSAGGCEDKATAQVTVVNIPTANAIVQNSNNLCSSSPVRLENLTPFNGVGSLTRVEIFWEYPNTTIKTTDNQPVAGFVYTHQYAEFGTPVSKTFTVVLRAYNANNCFTDYTTEITVLAAPKIQLTALANACVTAPAFNISNSATDVFGLGAIQITGNGVSGNNIFTPAVAGTGSHLLQYNLIADNGCSATAQQSIVVKAAPESYFNSNYTVLEGESVQLYPASPMPQGLQYQWQPATYLDNPASATPTVVRPASDISYTVKIIAADNCSIDTTVSVTVLSDFVVPNTFTPNNDGIYDTWRMPKLSKYPTHRVQVFNRYGQLLYETRNFPANGWDGLYKGKLLPFGTYYYIIELGGVQYPKKGYVTIVR
ncbi:MAG TPA: gliding motility-associated C-terminal domain-containing protein [Ferruginibacter sp.]|nr:gliding motility-associated C-terminal domain-containing protein [Ferruginibacter sp.]HMP22391.1 gliding motility-associated C-terminal domain-containing protein [Ferruginibacter sp.]